MTEQATTEQITRRVLRYTGTDKRGVPRIGLTDAQPWEFAELTFGPWRWQTLAAWYDDDPTREVVVCIGIAEGTGARTMWVNTDRIPPAWDVTCARPGGEEPTVPMSLAEAQADLDAYAKWCDDPRTKNLSATSSLSSYEQTVAYEIWSRCRESDCTRATLTKPYVRASLADNLLDWLCEAGWVRRLDPDENSGQGGNAQPVYRAIP